MSYVRGHGVAGLPRPVRQVVDEASGRTHRVNAALPRTGGPAGNARLTAWLGLIFLALILIELVTTLDVEGMLSWHVAVGGVLVPVAACKTASTSWRMIRYYRHNRDYVRAGPPPLLLRILGPFVVVSTVGLLVTGVVLIVVGPSSGRNPFLTVFGQGIDDLTLHQGFFIVFCAATGLHLLARVLPALGLVAGRAANGRLGVPGRLRRLTVLGSVLVVGVLAAVLLIHSESGWQHDRYRGAHFSVH